MPYSNKIYKHSKSEGHRAGCSVCDSRAIWRGAKASSKAIAHAKATGHKTWCEFTKTFVYVPQEA